MIKNKKKVNVTKKKIRRSCVVMLEMFYNYEEANSRIFLKIILDTNIYIYIELQKYINKFKILGSRWFKR